MALRPILTTGIALASAGAIVAATPALVTTPGIAVAASDSAVVESKRTVTVDQLNLLALRDINLQTLSDLFFRVDGWGGGVGPDDPYYPINENNLIYRDGLVGIAYYLSDQFLDEVIEWNLPIFSDGADFLYNNVQPYFYELGLQETFRVVASELTGGPNAPVGQALAAAEFLAENWIALTGTVLTSAAFAVPYAGPDLAAATNILFFGGSEAQGFRRDYAQGIDGIINYIADRLQGAPAWAGGPPEEEEEEEAPETPENPDQPEDPGPDPDEDPGPDPGTDADLTDVLAGDDIASITSGARATAIQVSTLQEEVEETTPEETPAEEESGTGADEDANDGSDAEAEKPKSETKKRSTKPRLNEKRDNSPSGADNTESSDSEESSKGKHRAEDNKPGSWKVGDKKDDTKTDGGSTGSGTDRDGGSEGGDDE